MYIVYILISQKDPQRYYIGFTQNLNQRVIDHNLRKSWYSKRYSPWKLNSWVVFENHSKALEFEKYLKSGSGFAFLKKRLI